MVKVSMQIPFNQRRVELNTERLPKLRSLYSKKYPLLTKTTSFAIVALSITGATIAAKRYLDYRGAQASLKRELNLAAKREEARLAEIEAAKRQEARLKKLTGRAGVATLVAGRSSAQRNIATPDGKSLRPRSNSDTAVSDLSGRLDRAGVPVDDARATFSNLGTPLTGELRGALDGSPENEDLTSITRRLIEAFGVDAPVQEGKAFSSAVLATQREGADRDGITESMRREPEEAAASRVSRDTSPPRRGGTRAIDLEAQRKEVKKESHSAYTKIAALALLAIETVAAIMKGTSTIALPKVESIPMGGAVVHYNVPGIGTGVEEFRGPEHSAFSVPLFPTDEGPTDPLIRQMIDDVYGDPALEAGESNSGVRVLPASVVEKYGDSIVNISSAYIPAQFYYGVCLLKEGKDIPKALKYLEHVFKLETLKTGPESWDSSCVYYYAKALEKMAALASSSADKNEFSRKSNEIFGYYQVLFPRGAFAKEVKATLKAHEALLKEEQISIDPELLQYDDCLEELADCLDRPALEARIRGAKEARERELMGKEESATRLFKAEEEYQSAISDAELGLKKIELAFASGSFDDLDHLQEPLAEKEVAIEQLSEEELELMEETYGTRDQELVALFKSAIDSLDD